MLTGKEERFRFKINLPPSDLPAFLRESMKKINSNNADLPTGRSALFIHLFNSINLLYYPEVLYG